MTDTETTGQVENRWGLSRRLGFLLTLALLPLGLIAMLQSMQIEEDLRLRTEEALQAETVQIAQAERALVDTAIGASQALALSAASFGLSSPACSEHLRAFVSRSDGAYVFAGAVDTEGNMTCSSTGQTGEFSQTESFQRALADPRIRVDVSANGPMSKQAVVIVTAPIRRANDELLGFMTVSLPRETVLEMANSPVSDASAWFFTANANGELVTASFELEDAASVLPKDQQVLTVDGEQAQNFDAESGAGTMTHYSVVPVVAGSFFAVGAWSTEPKGFDPRFFLSTPAAFALAMWLASLILITLTVERQVVASVRGLANKMRRFAAVRELPAPPEQKVAQELAYIETTFAEMAEKLIRDEADLLNAMVEQKVLLKEVHHRVSNNLQMISSLINMQSRGIEEAESMAVLDGIQRRVAGMAVVHKVLYRTDAIGKLRADDLLERVFRMLADVVPKRADRIDIPIERDVASVPLTPDQALPLAFFTIEGLANAVSYADSDGGAAPWVRYQLRETDAEGGVEVRIENSVSAAQARQLQVQSPSTSLGQRLIQTFALQLGGRVVVSVDDGIYCVSMTFVALPVVDPESDQAD
ncbi:hypothetical protein CLV78_10776 [Aliiruegeria haliotis]|uniref:histidine kinase n=1 Tax=Aliiruegeria haliotis TaxID=1280846 RepID=A0A2T0RM03_9RHOB|nr:sensor histidine kinase [Aliiruegeria haliotis]PRY22152.1 hypothetical protein CLV78_10776 [Aliiruegeria haliotis]